MEDLRDRWPEVKVFCHPAQSDSARVILEEAHVVLEFYEELFGTPYPFPTLDIAQMAYGVGFAHAPPGLVQMDGMAFLSKTRLVQMLGAKDPIIRELFLAHEIAHQWWAHTTSSRTDHDYWMMETFCEYAAALYREATRGPEGYQRYLDHWQTERAARNTKRTTSLWIAGTGRDGKRYVSTAYGRGPLVLHDIRMQHGLEAVVSTMRTVLANYYQKDLATEDLQIVLEKATGASFAKYFDQYVYGNVELPDRPFVIPEDDSLSE